VLRGHEGAIPSVAISADSHWLVTGSEDKTARLWDLTASDPATSARVLRGHEGAIPSIAISADSHWLVTGSEDKTARLWTLQTGELLDQARAVAGRNLSVIEWALYFGEKPYDRTFPEYPHRK
jgi:WD40 repeat protein